MKVAMNVAVVSTILFIQFLAIITGEISFCSGSFDVGEKLQDHKDPSNRLSSSHAGYDSLTGDVHEQHHRSLKAEYEANERGVKQLPWKNLKYLDLRSNLFEGPIPAPPPSMIVFLVSSNNFTGEIPQLICNSSTIEVLDLSNNSLSGRVPECLGNFSNSLRVLDLQKNRFNGSVPGTFQKGNSLKTLNFNGNGLEGSVPLSLKNCTNLEVLDLGNNNINDTFPKWLGDLLHLQVLVLRSNRFHGSIGDPKSSKSLSQLRVFDLSSNHFTGALPTKYFQNMKAIMDIDNDAKTNDSQYMGETYYEDTVTLVIKKNLVEQMKILKIFSAIDFSNNNFQGQIPKVIGNFHSLKLLNLSHNNLTGNIPSSLGNLMSLESLDFSSNRLNGTIPMQLVNLTFLSTLDLSDNRLTGAIPRGNQFYTFQNNSYSGNPGLCGFPLPNECNSEPPQPSLVGEDDELSENGNPFGWRTVLMGYGSGTVFGFILGCIILITKKPQWIVRIVEGEKHWKTKYHGWK